MVTDSDVITVVDSLLSTANPRVWLDVYVTVSARLDVEGADSGATTGLPLQLALLGIGSAVPVHALMTPHELSSPVQGQSSVLLSYPRKDKQHLNSDDSVGTICNVVRRKE